MADPRDTRLSFRRLRVDGQREATDVDGPPCLSWELVGPVTATDCSFRILAAERPDALDPDGAPLWDSGWTTAEHGGSRVVYTGPLQPLGAVHWTVQARTPDGHVSAWANPHTFRTSLLSDGRWDRPWITDPTHDVDARGRGSVAYFRRRVELPAPDGALLATVCALGSYHLYCNGQRVGDRELEPGWTDLHERVQYRTYDLTGLAHGPALDLELVLSDGWWAGHVGWFGRDLYGDAPAVTASVCLRTDVGLTELAATDDRWTVRRGQVTASDLLMGETQDLAGYRPGDRYVESEWRPASIRRRPALRVEPATMEPVRPLTTFPAVDITSPAPDVQLVDVGQHLAGRIRLRVRGEQGSEVVVRHGEALEDGELYTANLRSATQEHRFTLAGAGEELLEAQFSIQGFRYVEVTGPIAPLHLEDAEAVALGSDLPVTGQFHAADPLLDRLHHNVLWSQRGNFVSVPTDCPQRDERLGWTGDIHLFANTASFNLDPSRFLGTWLRSLADGQGADGRVPDIAPFVRLDPRPEGIQIAQPGWGDALIGVPWTLYLHHGDRRVLEQHWDGMRRWMATGAGGEDLIRTAGAYADWNFQGPETPTELIGTYWYARAAATMVKVAHALGDQGAEREFADLHTKISDAFRAAFLTGGRLHVPTQTGYVLALDGGFVVPADIDEATRHLVEDLADRRWTVTTGFVGASALLPVLSRHGHVDVAYQVARTTDFPSWGFHVVNDATTMWEHWDTWLPGERFQDPKMNSFNHFAFATIGDWLYRYVLGIRPDERAPGYRRVRLTPHPGTTLRHVRGRLDTEAGTVTASWWRGAEHVRFAYTIPTHAEAVVDVPWLSDIDQIASLAGPVRLGAAHDDGRPGLHLGPGRSSFTVPADLFDSR